MIAEPMLYVAHAGAVACLDEHGRPSASLSDPHAALERWEDRARLCARKRNRDGERVALTVAAEIKAAIAKAKEPA